MDSYPMQSYQYQNRYTSKPQTMDALSGPVAIHHPVPPQPAAMPYRLSQSIHNSQSYSMEMATTTTTTTTTTTNTPLVHPSPSKPLRSISRSLELSPISASSVLPSTISSASSPSSSFIASPDVTASLPPSQSKQHPYFSPSASSSPNLNSSLQYHPYPHPHSQSHASLRSNTMHSQGHNSTSDFIAKNTSSTQVDTSTAIATIVETSTTASASATAAVTTASDLVHQHCLLFPTYATRHSHS
ncbi:hypothetical protein BX616_001750, partial [Lobosporangium transversale]